MAKITQQGCEEKKNFIFDKMVSIPRFRDFLRKKKIKLMRSESLKGCFVQIFTIITMVEKGPFSKSISTRYETYHARKSLDQRAGTNDGDFRQGY